MTTHNNSNIHILVVDDEHFILNLTVRILKKLGYNNVETVGSGECALEKLSSTETPYDLIMSDLLMPGMDGIELMRCVRSIEFNGWVILFSGEDQHSLEIAVALVKGFNLNVLGAIQKPLQPIC